METARSDRTRQWLAAHDLDTDGDPNDAARDLMPEIRADDELSPADKLEIGLGLLEILGAYWVLVELRWLVNADESLWDTHWQALRDYLEQPRPSEAVLYSLWNDWFEDIETSQRAFTEVLGRDVAKLGGADEALLRRATAVLKVSGPVPWKVKFPVYSAAAEHERLHRAVFSGVLYSFHDVYGSLEIEPALELLDRLALPPDTEHLAELREELAAGHANQHHRD
ncbi:hypothetical protein [Dactylosporangium matsuzakiense]|uniref:Uncharacterized protein n=1 Tax=Dactylosporangium matsuzakiense TaxID=53360 RepID=A0A9W6KIG5_9ACTN|nr:hypothetical protein [Dactylosporangium matsuzakiense]UWZ47338.1 hypothetical protein Dmats_13590 [Dactylosporangium matsuzakiense]GLL01395.1 hypothetical protein GCM10017581_031360 [Dactylosporangium matsuzakiense]